MSPEYVGFGGAVKLFFRNYANFKGRSTRSEYWWWALAQGIIMIVLLVLYLLGMASDNLGTYLTVSYLIGGVMVLFCLAIVVPNLALSIRRLHDMGKSGWWFLINLLPCGGAIVFLVFTLQPSEGANKWGEPAKA